MGKGMKEEKKSVRLDRFLSETGEGTRSAVKLLIRKGAVLVNGETVKSPETKVDPERDIISVNGRNLSYEQYEYYMLNKPAGMISASRDPKAETVVDLIADSVKKDLFPVGRLDKDTEGLLLITNDGGLAHDLLSPKKHVDKVYYAKVAGTADEETKRAFSSGLAVDEEFTAMPAKLTVIGTNDGVSEVEITIREGKFHQIKRMFEAVGMEVLYLKRLSMGSLLLDPALSHGEYRRLTSEEIQRLKNPEQNDKKMGTERKRV